MKNQNTDNQIVSDKKRYTKEGRKAILENYLERLDFFGGGVDFNSLSERGSDAYREKLHKTANEEICKDEETLNEFLEMEECESFAELVSDGETIESLRTDKRKRLLFYLDLLDLCHTLKK